MHRLTYSSEQHQNKMLSIDENLKIWFTESVYEKYFGCVEDKKLCFQIHHQLGIFSINSSYYVGVDWIIKDKAALYIEPKLNDQNEINFLSMLIESLEAPENFNHLDNLFNVDYNESWITIPQKKDLLSPILIIQFLKLVQRIVKKGLKKSYYTVQANLNGKIKGKILVGKQIKENILKSRLINTVCEYQEFGFNFKENQFLKTVLIFVKTYIYQSKTFFSNDQRQNLISILNYCETAFYTVDELSNKHSRVKVRKNVFFNDYEEAVRIGDFILKRFSYNISKISESSSKTPPFWIDMSKLFELYVFKKLNAIFPEVNSVTYHDRYIGGKETDILIRVKEYEAVVDCKYKPQYKNHNPSLEDKRQLAGYTRLKRVYQKLGKHKHEIIKGLIIYSHQDFDDYINKEDLFNTKIEEYIDFYKLGIRLPEV